MGDYLWWGCRGMDRCVKMLLRCDLQEGKDEERRGKLWLGRLKRWEEGERGVRKERGRRRGGRGYVLWRRGAGEYKSRSGVMDGVVKVTKHHDSFPFFSLHLLSPLSYSPLPNPI